MSPTRERYFEWTLLGLILIIGGLLFYEALPFLNGALGAVTLYLLLRRTNFYLCTRFSRGMAPWIITLAVTCFVMVPLSIILWYLIDVVQNVDFDIQNIIQRYTDTITYLEQKTGLEIASDRTISFLTARATAIMNMFMSGINNTAVNLFTAILLLFFLLSGGMKMEKTIARCLPFSDNNKRLVISKVSTIVRSNAIGIPLLAIIQGGVAAIGYSLCGVNRPIEFGALTGFASMIPIIGSMLVWVPLAILQYFEHGLMPSLYLAAYGGLIISQCDNVLRMIMQKRMANTHPLITIFGVIAGLPLFGFMGLIFGPLLVAMFLLFLEMFVNQYIIGDSEHGIVSSPKRRRNKDPNNPGTPSLADRFKRHPAASVAPAPSAAQPAAYPAQATAQAPTQPTAQAPAPAPKRPNPHLEQPKAKNFKSAKAQSKQEKREGAKLRAAQNVASADLKATPSKATPAVKAEPKATAKAQSAKPETKNAQSAPKSNQSASQSAAQPETKSAPAAQPDTKSAPVAQAETKNAPVAQPEAKSAVVPAQDGGAQWTLSPKAPSPQQPDIPPFKHLGQSATVRALRAQERFDLGSRDPDAAKRHNLVARAVAQAIGSFDQLDDLEGSLEAPVLPPEKLKSAQTPPEAAPERKEVAPRERGANDQRTSADKRPANDKRQAPAQRERAATTPREHPATKGDRPARRERKHERPANSDSAPGRKERSRLVSKLKPQGAKPVRGKTRRSNLDYQVLRPESPHREPAPIVHTVVSRSAGFEPQEPKHTLRTQLVSVHTAKGTMLADPPRRRPSRRRPFH